ncbi:hypothetical protein CIHG_01368 [Coccidioides immitis H538.4]|uniref:Uncharacterized protein n=2 Tax=Coccidioides immitis TaxID=5501 RepID=A0A0J8RED9_COCIT|nr:hypothetical protein CIRG_01218 [Coccidioides immitis RMSCC 2394]KMU83585.1 hypothetical protein CIHG_01368 [Coccidioides immitis H538.4]
MDHKQPALSRTLPKDFTFHAFDEPRTPTRPVKELEIPPPPHHSSYRLRRPPLDILSNLGYNAMPFCSPDVPLPSIEFSKEVDTSSSSLDTNLTRHTSPGRLEVPPPQRRDPKTPEAQVREDIVGECRSWREESVTSGSDPIPRPSSACSNTSDSSVSSSGSFGSHPSFGGSCTSFESEIHDPFLAHSFPDRKQPLESPSKPAIARNVSPQFPGGHRWTSEMDNHLWNAYQLYLQDPTITPFKTVPGSVPPLGVSHRVAREARRTWPRVKHGLAKKHGQDTSQELESKADPTSEARSGSCTPKPGVVNSKPFWPRSDASTRKRLKQLCRRRFSIAPHYQRLLQSRSPSPFPELFIRSSSSSLSMGSYGASNPFARDLGVSLVATSLPASIPAVTIENKHVNSEQTNWFNNVAEQPLAMEPQTKSELQPPRNLVDEGPATVPRLGSPFMYHTWGPDTSRRHLRPVPPANVPETIHGPIGSRLRSSIPPEMITSAHKRRAMNQLDDEISPDRNAPPDLLPEPSKDEKKNPNYRRVRLRNRGATTSGLSSRERLNQLFTPPSHFGSNESKASALPATSSQAEPRKEEIKRLGSPFNSDRCAGRSLQSRHAPSRSEPFILARPTRDRASSLQSPPPFYFQHKDDVVSPPQLESSFTEASTMSGPHLHAPDARGPYS